MGRLIPRSEYLGRLRARVSPSERAALENESGLIISRYNRATILRMLSGPVFPDGFVDASRAEGLASALQEYLNRYMADQPQGHKWIVLSCLFLALVMEEPMHPREIVGWERDGGAYFCPAREDAEGSVCRWCVCRPAKKPY